MEDEKIFQLMEAYFREGIPKFISRSKSDLVLKEFREAMAKIYRIMHDKEYDGGDYGLH